MLDILKLNLTETSKIFYGENYEWKNTLTRTFFFFKLVNRNGFQSLCSGLVLRYPDVFVDFLLFVELSEQGAQSVAGASTRPIGSGGRETRCTTWRASRARHANASCRPGRNLPCTSTKSSARPTTWRRLTEGTAPTTVRRSQYSGQLLSLGEMISAFFFHLIPNFLNFFLWNS